jgi:hypothetical protein
MPTLHASLRLRPTRIGFLVRPDDCSTVRMIMRYCTCLWGGSYNPIIPVAQSLPTAWEAPFSRISGPDLARGYVDFFEPDVYVESAAGLSAIAGIEDSRLGIGAKRVAALDEFVERRDSGVADFKFGLGIFELYRDLYRREFQFSTRHERRIARVTSNADDAAFVEAVFGNFPDAEELAYVEHGYREAFAPEEIPITPVNWAQIVENGVRTPLHFTRHGIQPLFSGAREPTIFVFDPTSALDLIDWWNLRLFQRAVIPINLAWFMDLKDWIRNLIQRNHRPIKGNIYGTMATTTVEFARSISETRATELVQQALQDLPDHSWARKQWYDSLWEHHQDDLVFRPRRATLTAEESSLELSVTETTSASVRFNAISPKFAERFGGHAARWVNVLSFARFNTCHDLALSLPSDFPDLPRLRMGEGLFASREGLVLPMEHRGGAEYLRIPQGSDAIATWLGKADLSVTKADTGRIADQVLASTGGIGGAFILESKETLKLLDKMARSIRPMQDGSIAEYAARTATVEEWQAVLARRSTALRKVTLEDFVEAGALKLGLSIQCENCRGLNWYSLAQLDEHVPCERCLKTFAFPQATLTFKSTPWRYRVAGPFAVADFAGGAYSTVLALRTFAAKLGSRDVSITFSTNLDIKLSGRSLEVDFAMWFAGQRAFGENDAPRLVLGEAKSFADEAIQERDVQRMQDLASAVPGTCIAFAVLKDGLSAVEKDRLQRLALWGRELLPNGELRAPVIVLTAGELFADYSIEESWEAAGGKSAALASVSRGRMSNLRVLADLTQQLHLDLESIDAWLDDQWKKKRLKAPSSVDSPT